ncbi:MAG: hypothetical protein K2P99_04345, partial [Burkholderiales bacterium]|nr:hypothetical protein [Burkholderiales bacterium]
ECGLDSEIISIKLEKLVLTMGHIIVDSVLKQYSQFVRPMYRKFVEPTKRLAHIIIPHGSNKAALEMIVSRIQSVLSGQSINITQDIPYDEDSE